MTAPAPASADRIAPDGAVLLGLGLVLGAVAVLAASALGRPGFAPAVRTLDIFAVPVCAALALLGVILGALSLAATVRDRRALQRVRAAQPLATLLPVGCGNSIALRRIQALVPGLTGPTTAIAAADTTGLSLWWGDGAAPVIALPWSRLGGASAEVVPSGRASVVLLAVAGADGAPGLAFTVRRAFGTVLLRRRRGVQAAIGRLAAARGSTLDGMLAPQPAPPPFLRLLAVVQWVLFAIALVVMLVAMVTSGSGSGFASAMLAVVLPIMVLSSVLRIAVALILGRSRRRG